MGKAEIEAFLTHLAIGGNGATFDKLCPKAFCSGTNGFRAKHTFEKTAQCLVHNLPGRVADQSWQPFQHCPNPSFKKRLHAFTRPLFSNTLFKA
jgi:hypothetical protein